MRLKKVNPLKLPHPLLCNYAMEIVADAYYKGFISWNVLTKALEKINTNKNGSWMFEQNEYLNHK